MPENKESLENHLNELSDYFTDCPQESINAMTQPLFVRCDEEEKSCILAFNTDKRLENPNGTLHGGVIATMLDNAMGCMANFYGEKKLTQTVSFQVSYLRPGAIGQEVMVKVQVTKQGRTMQYLNAEAWMKGKEEKKIATATGVYFTQNLH